MKKVIMILMLSVFLYGKGILTEQKYICLSTNIINLSTGDINQYQTLEQALNMPLRFYITTNGEKLITDADKKEYRTYFQEKDSKTNLTYKNDYQIMIVNDNIDFKTEKIENFMIISIPMDIKELRGFGFIYDKCTRTESWTLHNN